MKKLRIWDGTKMVYPDKGSFLFTGVPQHYTGLLDCEGNEIYEGDILEDIDKEPIYEKGIRTEVFFLYGSFCGSFCYDLMPFSLFNCLRKDNKLLKYKIVGHKYERI